MNLSDQGLVDEVCCNLLIVDAEVLLFVAVPLYVQFEETFLSLIHCVAS